MGPRDEGGEALERTAWTTHTLGAVGRGAGDSYGFLRKRV
jgi:hypothetical protein